MNSQTGQQESNVIITPINIHQESVIARQWFPKFQEIKELRPQTASLIAGTTVMMYSGMHLGWGIFNWNIGDQEWAQHQNRNTLVMCICSWFIAAIFGLIISSFMVKKTSKFVLYVSYKYNFVLI